jgi:undecaprenyl-diphosphatase
MSWRPTRNEGRADRDHLSAVARMAPSTFWALMATLSIVWSLTLLVQGGWMDHVLLSRIYVGGHAGLTNLARTITHLGSWRVLYPVLALAAALLLFQKRIRAAFLVLAIPISGRWLVLFQKHEFALMRPPKELHLVQIQGMAFPSGHTASATMAYLSSALLFAGAGRLRAASRSAVIGLAVILSIIVGCSRIMLAVHWPADVVGGWAFGGAWTLACLRLAEIIIVD